MNYSGTIRIMFFTVAALMSLTPLCAEKHQPPRERSAAKGRNMRGNAVFWRVFSQLSDVERKKMQELQRNNPDEFAAEMRKLVEAHEKQVRAQIERLAALIERYRKSTDEKERTALKKEITRMEREQFEQRLAGLARTIASTKRRLAVMEDELNKRKAKKDAIVDARVEALLSGELPVPVPPHLRRGAPPHPPRRGNMVPPHLRRGAPPHPPRRGNMVPPVPHRDGSPAAPEAGK